MLKNGRAGRREPIVAILMATILIGSAVAGCGAAWAGGGTCALVPNERDPSVKILQCGHELTVRAAPGTRYRALYNRGQLLPSAIRVDDGALLIEFHALGQQNGFQILTPLAIAAVRGTKWAVEVSPKRTSVLSLVGVVGVYRRLNQNEYVALTEGEGADISEGDTSVTKKEWAQPRVRALLSRFGE